jgi:DNA-binding TFAR19-related protein (PDSD5 family)
MSTERKENQSLDEDASMKMLNAKRLLELRKRASLASAKQAQRESSNKRVTVSDREVLLKALVDRGDEVLASAEASYPNEMRILIPRLAELIRQGKVSTISGGELLQFLRAVGLRVNVSTSISVEEHGKLVSLADKLRQTKD